MKLLKLFPMCFLLIMFSQSALSKDYLVVLESQHSVKETADRMVALIEEKDLKLFSRINHQANAKDVGLELHATEVIVFGNPNVGTKLMQCAPTVAIDLPQKALVWQDASGVTQLAYPSPAYLKELHSIEGCDEVLDKITKLLDGLGRAATTE